MLARPELEQLAQRVIARFHLDALSESETCSTSGTGSRLPAAAAPIPFDREAMQRIHQLVARGAATHQLALRSRAARRLCATGAFASSATSSTKRPGGVRQGAGGGRATASDRLSRYRRARRSLRARPRVVGAALLRHGREPLGGTAARVLARQRRRHGGGRSERRRRAATACVGRAAVGTAGGVQRQRQRRPLGRGRRRRRLATGCRHRGTSARELKAVQRSAKTTPGANWRRPGSWQSATAIRARPRNDSKCIASRATAAAWR